MKQSTIDMFLVVLLVVFLLLCIAYGLMAKETAEYISPESPELTIEGNIKELRDELQRLKSSFRSTKAN